MFIIAPEKTHGREILGGSKTLAEQALQGCYARGKEVLKEVSWQPQEIHFSSCYSKQEGRYSWRRETFRSKSSAGCCAKTHAELARELRTLFLAFPPALMIRLP
jgi:hypothetical protein